VAKNNRTGRVRDGKEREGTGKPLISLGGCNFRKGKYLASKIQARARERGVSVDVYLRELIDQKGTESERSNGLSSQERVRMLREWASGHSTNTSLLSDDAISRENIYGARG
jgi:hypothetical protein